MAKAKTPEKSLPSSEHQEENLNRVLEIIRLMGENEIAELELDVPGLKLSLKKHDVGEEKPMFFNPAQFQPMMPATFESSQKFNQVANGERTPPTKVVKETEAPKIPVENANRHKILSPMAGTFYRAPSPTSPPYVEEGQKVTAGQPVCIVEAMKLMNEIKADKTGKIVKILVENAKPVEKGSELFIIELGE